ncbi:MAG: mechanosensitive ion channel [Bacteroidales bacterium]|nr:mechanosensitive ion channel [Bacteroidales bacterium]NCA87193.1 mechanosensitive ion channel [Clostridia bacterium]MDD2631640.1 mechanosensitive ion channel [Bacteroidales bacterium]MDD3132802.1 mechanosensitive ion channel [Bacteroidales bacterium]MDD3526328.1 mechanosensitive ion channel [Bacteroidales bacterium]
MDKIDVESPIAMVVDKIQGWVETFISMLPNMAVAIVLLIIFIVVANLASRLFKKVFSKTSDHKALEGLFATIIKWSILFVGIFIILSILQLSKAVTSILAGVGILGLALGFAFQDITANFISGIILAFRRPFAIGQVIKVSDIMGTAKRTNLRVTVIQTFQGQEVFVPNKDVLQNPIINYSAIGKRRIDLGVGISYGDDLAKVQRVVLETIKNLEGVIDKENIVFDYGEFGDSSINFTIRFWIKYPGDPGFLVVRNNAIMKIKEAFDQNDIMIPFPIRTLDFGIKGGEKLSEMKLDIAASKEQAQSERGQDKDMN